MASKGRKKVGKFVDLTDKATVTASTENGGNPVTHALTESYDQYWESSGNKPHTLTLTFKKPLSIAFLRMVGDPQRDSSYQPEQWSLLVKKGKSSSFKEVLPMSAVTYGDRPDDAPPAAGFGVCVPKRGSFSDAAPRRATSCALPTCTWTASTSLLARSPSSFPSCPPA